MVGSIIDFLIHRVIFPVVDQLLYNFGFMSILERVVSEDVDVLYPVSRLSVWAAKNDKAIEYVYEREGGRIVCVIKVDGREEVRVGDLWKGKMSQGQEEVKFAAAEKAIGSFKLRDGNIHYSRSKRRRNQRRNELEVLVLLFIISILADSSCWEPTASKPFLPTRRSFIFRLR